MNDDDKLKAALAGYQVAVNLWTYEGQGVWAVFSAFLVANSLILSSETFVLKEAKAISGAIGVGVKIGLPFFGLLLCLLWALISCRRFAIHGYRVLAARELEEHLGEAVQTVTKGGHFSEGHEVQMKIKGVDGQIKSECKQMPCFVKRLRSETLVYLTILLFALLQLGAGIVLLWG